jgi:hypothetical protein
MKRVAIIPRDQHDIAHEVSDCIACLENIGIQVYATHRGEGYAVLWAEDPIISSGARVLRNAGFEAAPLNYTRSSKFRGKGVHIRTPITSATLSN